MDIPEPERATKAAGKALFILCVGIALSIFVLNTSLVERRALLIRNSERHDAHTQMVERLNSFRAKDADLFEHLVASSFSVESQIAWSQKGYPGLLQRVPLSKGGWRIVTMPEERRGRLTKATRSFGAMASTAFASGKSVDSRLQALRSIATQAFGEDLEARSFVTVELAPKLAALDTPSEWEQIAWWIAGGEWPSQGGIHGIGGPGGVTFGARVSEWPTSMEDQFYAYRLLQFSRPPESADQELFNLWKMSHVDKWSAVSGTPRLAIPTLGLSISAEAVVAMAAPILMLFQLLFLVYWERSAGPTSSDNSGFAFPSYGCPNDPLDGPLPATLGELVQRFVWTLFLILPICIFAVGLLTRYDLHYPLGYFHGSTTTLFEAEQQARTSDVVSRLIDWATLGCMALSAIVAFRITRPRFPSSRRTPRTERTVAVIALIAALASAWACIIATRLAFDAFVAPISNGSSVTNNMGYLEAFGVVWSIFFGVALQQRARLLALVSVLGLGMFVLHFVSLSHLARAITSTQ